MRLPDLSFPQGKGRNPSYQAGLKRQWTTKHRVAFMFTPCECCLFKVPVPPLSVRPLAKPDNAIFPDRPGRSTIPPLCFGSRSSLTLLPTLYFHFTSCIRGLLALSAHSCRFKLLEGRNYVLFASVSHPSYIIVLST